MRSSSLLALVATVGAAVVSATSYIVSVDSELTAKETANLQSAMERLGWEIIYDYNMFSAYAISGDGDIAQVEALEGVLMVNEDQEVSILDGGNELPASSSSDVTD